MSRGPARFKQTDVRKAIKAAAGEMAVEICPDGRIRLVPFAARELTPIQQEDDLERELQEFRARCEGQP